MTWFSKIKHSIKNYIAREHVTWEVWNSVWSSLKAKENIPQTPWWEFSSGASPNGQLYQKLNFGLWEENQRISLSKVTLELLVNPKSGLHLYKKQHEICSTSVEGLPGFAQFWSDLKSQAFNQAKNDLETNFLKSSLKLVDSTEGGKNPMDEELKVYNWVNTTLIVLKNALGQLKLKPDQFLTARVLMGKLPLQDSIQVQIHCFNVEINYMSQNGKNWHILVYDHKDGSLAELKPSLSSSVELQSKNIWGLLSSLIQEILKN